MKYDELKNMKIEQLTQRLLSLKKEYLVMRFQKVLDQSYSNTARLRETRANIARTATCISRKTQISALKCQKK